MTSPTFDLTNFRFYDDDGTGEDDQSALGSGNNQTLDRATTSANRFCVRVEIYNDNAKAGNEVWEWEYSYDGGAWTPISLSSSVIRAYDSALLVDNENCTQRLTSSIPFLVANVGVTEDGVSGSVGMGAGDYAEALLSCYIVDADVADGLGIDIRVVEGGGDVITYTNTPSLTIDKSGITVAPAAVSAIASTVNPTVIVPGLSVLHYRVRNGDVVGLNVDSDWKWVLDTDGTFDAGTVFRVRVELENAAGTGAAKTFKLQYKLNAGAWTDVTSLLESATTGPIMSVPSSQFTDLDATTNLLSGSTETFEAGQGLSDNPDTSAITLISEHTEYEWALLIEGFYDGPTQISDGDTIALRVVETDNTLLDSYPLTPTFTVNVPDFYIGGCYSETPARAGPIADADGNLYFLMEPAETDNVPIMVKSTDGGRQWTLMDDAGGPTTVDLECHDMFLVGDTIHILQHSTTDVVYHAFLVSTDGSTPDTWSVIDQSIRTGISGLIGQQTCALARRSDGDLIAFYNVYVAGPNEDRLFYKINDGTWGSELTLEDEAAYEWHQVIAVVGASDLTHIFYKGDNGTLGPIWHRSLSSADSLSAREAVDADSGPASAEEAAMTQGVYWNDGGNEKVMVVYKGSDDYLYSVVVTDDGTPETPRQASDNTVIYNMGGSRQPTASLVLNGDDAYLHYADAATLDIYRTEMVNDGGWNTDVEELDAVTAHWIRGLVFTHSVGNGSDTVVGYAYDNGSGGGTGYIFYDEFNIAFSDSVTPTAVGTIASGVDPTVITGFPNGFHQPNFRFRAGDTDVLNGTTDWKWALNTDGTIDAGTVFRFRAEVAEYNSLEGSTQFKLQYRLNAGTWTDVGSQLGGINTPIIHIFSLQYTDLDATTNILSGSSETFEAGTGVSDISTNLTTAITLNAEHSEFEWTLLIQKRFSNYQELVTSDEIELRVVESDGTAFPGTYNIPTITVNIPDYYIGGTFVESPQSMGPVADSNGNLYFTMEHNSTTSPTNNNTCIMLKSTDGGKQWNEIDGAGRPATTDYESGDMQIVGEEIHLVQHSGANVRYHKFHMSAHATTPDTWVVVDEVISSGVVETDQAVAFSVLSDGDIYCFYRETVSTFERIVYKRRTSGSWGSSTNLDAEASTNFTWVTCTRGASDLTHVFYQEITNGAGNMYHRSLSTGGTLSGRESISASSGIVNNHSKGIAKPIYWDDAGDETIMVVYREGAANTAYSRLIINDGTPAARVQAADVGVNRAEGGSNMASMQLVGVGDGDAYLVYSDITTEDLWLAAYESGSWGTDVELIDNVTVDFQNIGYYTHNGGNGGNTVAGVITEYNDHTGDDGYIWYVEEILASGGVLVTPTAVSSIASSVNPTVVKGSISVTPTAVSSIATKVDPVVVQESLVLSPAFVYTIASKVDPTVALGSTSVSPAFVSAISSSVDPFVIQSSLALTATAVNTIALCVDPLVVLGNTAYTPTPTSSIGSTVNPFVIQSSLLLDTTPLSAITSSVNPTVVKGSLSLTPSARNAIARGVDPTVVAGADVLFTPDPVSTIAGKVDPTVELGSTVATPTPTSAIASKVDPSVLLSSTTATPSPASSIASKVDPTVIQESLALSPAFGFTIADSVDPTIVLGSMLVTPAAINAVATGVDPTVLGEGTVVTPSPISSIASSVNPTVALGSTVATPSPVTSIGNKVDPTVVLGSLLLTPTPVSVNTDSVPPTTVLGSLSVTPSVVSCLTGKADPTVVLGSTSLTPGVASAIGTSVNPTVLYGSTVAIPNAVGAVATGVDPNVLGGGVFFTPTPVSVVAGKVDPTVVLSSVSVTPVAANAVASAVDPTVLTPISLTPTPVSSIAGSIGPSIILGDLTISPLYGNIICSTVDPTVVQSSLLISSTPASAIASSVDPTIVLGDATVVPTPAVSLCSTVDPVVVISSGDLVVTPAAVSTIASTVDPTTILSSMVVAPTSATTIASSTGPVVQEGALLVTPSPVTSVTSVVPPIIVLSSMVVTPSATFSIASTLDPTVVLSSTTAQPAFVYSVSSSLDPSVILGSMAVSATPALARASSIDPAVILGSIAFSPDPATAISQVIMFAVLLSGTWFDEVRADLLITKEVDHDLYVTQEEHSDLFLD